MPIDVTSLFNRRVDNRWDRCDVTIEIGGAVLKGSRSFADVCAEQPVTPPEVTIHGDDIWQILFTSGRPPCPRV